MYLKKLDNFCATRWLIFADPVTNTSTEICSYTHLSAITMNVIIKIILNVAESIANDVGLSLKIVT